MRWTAWWSAALLGVVTIGCGSGVSPRVETTAAQEVAAVSSDCAYLENFFSELLALTNKARQEAGVSDLKLSYQLGQAAQTYAEDLATQNFFSHTGEDGSTVTSRIGETGYQFEAVGENLAAGQQTAESVFNGWMSSAGHRANILQEDFTEVGFGMFDSAGNSDYGRYWVQNFGKPESDQSGSGSIVYIPDICETSIAYGESATDEVVAGFYASNSGSASSVSDWSDLPLESLTVGVASGVTGQPESVPEPAVLIGLGALGWLLWRGQLSQGAVSKKKP